LVEVQRDAEGNPKYKPDAVLRYNKLKPGIDKSDQMSSYYTPLRRSIFWYKKVALELVFGVALVNAHITYNQSHMREPTRLARFRASLLKQLIAKADDLQKREALLDIDEGDVPVLAAKRPRIGDANETESAPHYLFTLPLRSEHPQQKDLRARCRYCAKRTGFRGANTKTLQRCFGCPGLPGFHTNCFAIAHNMRVPHRQLRGFGITYLQQSNEFIAATPRTHADANANAVHVSDVQVDEINVADEPVDAADASRDGSTDTLTLPIGYALHEDEETRLPDDA
jgi:hypothetical protein